MPNRILRDAILSSESVASLTWAEEVFHRRLMSVVDDYGRIEANPQLLRSRCYPLQTDTVRVKEITGWLAACQKAGLVLCYAVDGKQYLEICKFNQQQRTASKCPQPLAIEIICDQKKSFEHLGVSVFVGEDVDVIGSAPKGADRFEEMWDVLPPNKRKGAKGECLKLWKAKGLDAKADEIIKHINSMRADWEKEGGQFMPAPLVYLRSERWDGADVEEPRSKWAGCT